MFKLFTSDQEVYHSLPEKRLVVNILLRAVKDLASHVHPHYRRDAINWFDGVETERNYYREKISVLAFSFDDVVEILDLNDTQIKMIQKWCRAAERKIYGELEAEGEESGAGLRPFFKEPGMSVGYANSAIRRRYGYGGFDVRNRTAGVASGSKGYTELSNRARKNIKLVKPGEERLKEGKLRDLSCSKPRSAHRYRAP